MLLPLCEIFNKDIMENLPKDVLFSSTVKAGRRTYFFDVKETRAGEKYLTITESKKFTNQETGDVKFEKHRVFLYQEDFEEFVGSMNESLDFIKNESE